MAITTLVHRSVEPVRRFFMGGGFPAFFLSLLIFYEVFLLGMLWVPAAAPGLGAFAEDFRIWCYGYDPATGRTQWAYVVAMVLPQLGIATLVALMWWQPLRELLARPRRIVPHALAAALLVAGLAAGFSVGGTQPATGELPFPAESLRTAFRPPDLALTNQLGEPIDLAALRGKVVMLTAVYASCGHTCPALLTQAKRAVAALDPAQLEDLRVVAVTLDPENDTSEVLAGLAENHGMEAPLYNLVTGEPARVEAVLDQMEVARQRNPETGVIDHANLVLLIDRKGQVAYRLGLGERQERWLTSALRVLLREPATAS